MPYGAILHQSASITMTKYDPGLVGAVYARCDRPMLESMQRRARRKHFEVRLFYQDSSGFFLKNRENRKILAGSLEILLGFLDFDKTFKIPRDSCGDPGQGSMEPTESNGRDNPQVG